MPTGTIRNLLRFVNYNQKLIVLLPGFQKGRDIYQSKLKEKGREQSWPKRAICVVQEKT
jgi:hypothetical protein